MFMRRSAEVAALKERFQKEVAAILNHTKVIQVFVAGLKEGQRLCDGNQKQDGEFNDKP